jgi:hypothetical protein
VLAAGIESTAVGVWVALGLTVGLVALHLAAPRIRRLPGIPESATGSFASGLAVAYVFLHLLPELADGNESIGEALRNVMRPTPLTDLGVFVVALVGFALFYGLSRLADARARDERTGGAVFVLHLASFAVYNALITYTMPLRVRTGLLFAVLFAVAMALHFVLTDRALEEHYGARFGIGARLVLAGALLVGWAVAAVAAPTSTVLVAVLTAALAGSILWNVFRDEVPASGRASYPWFLTGLVVYAGLLALVTWTSA